MTCPITNGWSDNMASGPQIYLEDGDSNLRHRLAQELLASLGEINRQSTNQTFSFFCEDAGSLVGGISCSLSYDWMHLELLWVKTACRRQGLATRLLARAEAHAAQQGAKRAWLETSNRQATAFYAARGFIPFGRLTNDETQFPPEIERVFMEKRVGASVMGTASGT